MTLDSSLREWVTSTIGPVNPAAAWQSAERWQASLAPLVLAAEAEPHRIIEFGDRSVTPEISVILPAGLDEAALGAKAATLADHAMRDRLDVVLVGNAMGDPDSLETLARTIAADLGVPVSVVQPNGVPTPAHAFALGASVARGDLLLFVHADVEPSSAASLATLVDFARRHPAAGVIGGKTLDPSREFILEAGVEFGRSPNAPVWLPLERGHRRYRLDPDFARSRPVPALGASGLLVRREALDQAGGWPSGYLGDWFAAADLCHRIWTAGWQAWVLPAAEFERALLVPLVPQGNDPAWLHDAWLHDRRWADFLQRRQLAPPSLAIAAADAIASGMPADGQLALDRLLCLLEPELDAREPAWRDQRHAAAPLAEWGLDVREAEIAPAAMGAIAWATACAAAPGSDRLILLTGAPLESGEQVSLQVLDAQLAPLTAAAPVPLRWRGTHPGGAGDARLEDVRLTGDGRRWLATATASDPATTGDRRHLLLDLDLQALELRELHSLPEEAGRSALPLAAGEELALVTRLGPTETLLVDTVTGGWRTLASHDAPRLAETLRGSSPLCAIDGGYLGIVRDTLAGPDGIHRIHRFATFSPDFRLTALSRPFTAGRSADGHCAGLAVVGDRIVVTCVDEREARLFSLRPADVGAHLQPVESLMADGAMAWPDRPQAPGSGESAPDPVARLIAAAAARTCLAIGLPAGEPRPRGPIHVDADALARRASLEPADLTILDASRGFARTLSDVILAERASRLGGALAIRGVSLPGLASASGEREPSWARGEDGWKILPCLAALRPDLSLVLAEPGPDAPDGMLIVTGLDPASSVLGEGQRSILAAFSGDATTHPPALRQALQAGLPAPVPFDAALLALATASVARLQAGDREADALPPFGHLPVYIPAFNNPSYAANMVRQLRGRQLMPVVVDNASTAPAMRTLLDGLEDVPVVRLAHNLGGQFFLTSSFYAQLPELFCLTDPDLELNPDLPGEFLEQLVAVTERFQAGKAGFALDITDREALGDHVHYSKVSRRPFRAWEWEEQFWRNRLGETPDGDPIYEGFIDTTFFVLNKRFCIPEHHGSGLRVAGRFAARHLPWYRDCPVASPEEKAQYAASRAVGQWDHGAGGGGAPDILAIVSSRGRPAQARACVDALRASSTRCRIVLAVDEDDPDLPAYRTIPGAAVEPGPPAGRQAAVNRVAAAHAGRYRHLAVIPDDALVHTAGWDDMAASAIWDLPEGVVTLGPADGDVEPPVLLRSAVARRVGDLLPLDLPAAAMRGYWAGLGAGLGGLRERLDVAVDRIPERTPDLTASTRAAAVAAPAPPIRFEPGMEGVQRLRALFLEAVRRLAPDLFVEVGAHEAAASATVARWLPACQVIALEANPSVHARHRDRLAALGVDYRNLAAAESSGSVRLYVPLATGETLLPEAVQTGRASLRPRSERTIHAEIDVPALALDDLIAPDGHAAGDARVALWVDVEGAAHEVLLGARRVLAGVRIALVEMEGEPFWSGQRLATDVERLMADRGFTAVARDGELGDRQFNILFAREDGLGIVEGLATGAGRPVTGGIRWRRDVDPAAVLASLASRSEEEIGNAISLSQELGYAFFVVPKAASSLIRTSLNRELARRLGADPGDAWLPSTGPHDRVADLGPGELADILADPDWRLAAFVRNPHARLLSMFLHLRRLFAESGTAHYRLTDLGFPQDTMPSFAEFVSVIAALPDADADWHWKSQLALLPVPPDQLTFLGRYERLDRDYWELGRLLFGPEGFGDPRDGIPIDTLATHAPRTDAEAHLSDFYTPELQRLVAERYAADFAALGYDPERLGDAPVPAKR